MARFAVALLLLLCHTARADEWTKEAGARVAEGNVPFVFQLDDGTFRLFCCSGSGIGSAISKDGLNFTIEAGVRLAGTGRAGDPESIVCDPSMVRLPDGRYRLYYKGSDGPGGPGQAVHRVYSAVSADGLNFTREGLRLESKDTVDNGWASVPEVVRTFDGRYRMYYVSNGPPERTGLVSAVSDDGLNFTREPGVRMPGPADAATARLPWVDPAVVRLPSGQYWLFGLVNVLPPASGVSGIYSAHSADGLNFVADPGPLVTSPGTQTDTFDPTVIGIGENRFRMYYGSNASGPPLTLSAVGTETPNAGFGVAAARSAADSSALDIAPDSLVTIYGQRLATGTATASLAADGHLPKELAGTRVSVNGLAAELAFARADQINLVLPSDIKDGPAQLIITAGDGRISTALATATRVAARLFTPVVDARSFQPGPFRMSADPLLLTVFCTGLRNAGDVKVRVGEQNVTVLYAGRQPTFPGLDQINVLLPADFPVRGKLPVCVSAGGRDSNCVTVELQ
jgi:uncharacterized protein (TIGR03437 family)